MMKSEGEKFGRGYWKLNLRNYKRGSCENCGGLEMSDC